jgi:hypothetical protein
VSGPSRRSAERRQRRVSHEGSDPARMPRILRYVTVIRLDRPADPHQTTIRWQPRADPGQKQEPATGSRPKGIDTCSPVTSAQRLMAITSRMLVRALLATAYPPGTSAAWKETNREVDIRLFPPGVRETQPHHVHGSTPRRHSELEMDGAGINRHRPGRSGDHAYAASMVLSSPRTRARPAPRG